MSVALLSSASALAAHFPYFHLGSIDTGVVPIQAFGILVAAGVLIGASLLRRYAEWHGVSDDDIRGLTAWVTVSGFIGAHVFDVLAYQWPELTDPTIGVRYVGPILLLKVWSGISSYGGFIGGAGGFAFYVWWKRLPARLMADITILGLLPAFSIGRIGCTVVSDHIGALVDQGQWYAFLAMDYPVGQTGDPPRPDATNTLGAVYELARDNKITADHLLAWNLGLIELLWLIPVNALILYLGFRKKRLNAGMLVVLTGVLYAPVRFFLDYLRPEDTDPRYWSLTFAQWSSFLAFGAAAYVATRIARNGKEAKVIAPTSGEAQEQLKVILRESDEDDKADKDDAPKAKAKGSKKGTGNGGFKKAKKSAASASETGKDDAKPAAAAKDKEKAPVVEDAVTKAKRLKEEEGAAAAEARRAKVDAERAKAAADADAAKAKADANTDAKTDDAKPAEVPPTLGPDD